MKTVQHHLLILVCLLMFFPVHASDFAKEQRWASQVTDFLLDGEPVWLEADKHRFLGIYAPSMVDETSGAVILIHGIGVHPDWPQVIQPLRTRLPANGWATLSLQMPILPNEAKEADYVPLFKEVPARIQAGIDFLEKQNISNIILVGHSLGASMASYFLAEHRDSGIQGFVGIGMNGKPRSDDYMVLDTVNALLQISIPVLDVYGSKSNAYILESVDRRAYVVYHNGNDISRQVKISGADHFFQGYEGKLLNEISKWLIDVNGVNQDRKVTRISKESGQYKASNK
jgi:predicted alpha/beta-hydrolase family hydrolase